MKKTFKIVGLLLLPLAAYLLLWPVDIDPAAWDPPAAPALVGAYGPNDALAKVARLPVLDGAGPEDTTVGPDGLVYAGLDDGRIIRMGVDGAAAEVFVNTGGRPLGMQFDAKGSLIVADAVNGLLSISTAGDITVLVASYGDVPFKFTDDLDIASDGTIYFTDASYRWDHHHVREDFMDHRPYGRFLSYSPTTKETTLLADALYFANGVALAHDESFVLVNETSKYRVRRYWLKGDKKGQLDTFIDNLPGLPDNIETGSGGRFWLSLYSPRLPELDALLPMPFLRKVVYRLPAFLQPDPARHGFIVVLNDQGHAIGNLQDATAGSFSPVTSVYEHEGQLFLGSLSYPGVGAVAAPSPSP